MTASATDIFIVGGGPAGMMTGITAAQFWPHKKVLVVRPESDAVIPCGIPYIFGTLEGTEEDLARRAPLLAAGAKLRIDRVVKIDRRERTADLADGDLYVGNGWCWPRARKTSSLQFRARILRACSASTRTTTIWTTCSTR